MIKMINRAPEAPRVVNLELGIRRVLLRKQEKVSGGYSKVFIIPEMQLIRILKWKPKKKGPGKNSKLKENYPQISKLSGGKKDCKYQNQQRSANKWL